MLEGVVTNLLNQYLGQILEGLDSDQLKISVWSGEVNLVNVRVKPGALDFLHLPIVVKHGYVKRLHISANWRNLSSKPVKVELIGVSVVAVPSSKATVDSNVEIANQLASKLAKLQGMEDLRFGSEEEDSPDSYMGSMANKIIDNVEIRVSDIHVRYEDFGGPHAPTSFGIALEELKAETTDDQWKPAFVKNTKKTYKMVTLEKLFSYMNVDDVAGVAASHSQSPLSVSAILQDPSTSYLLRPVSGALRMWVNKETYPHPRVWIDSQLYDISLQLTERQYVEVLGVINRVSASHLSMTELIQSFKDRDRTGTIAERRIYVDLYKRTLNALWLEPLTPAQVKQKDQLEHDLRYDDIRKYRLAAIAELKRELGILGAPPTPAAEKEMKKADRARASIMLRERAKKLTATFLSKIGMGKGKKLEPDRHLDEREKEEIFATVEAEGVDQLEELPKEYVHVQLKFMLDTLGFALADRENRLIAVLKAEQTQVGLTVRDTSLSTIVTLGNIVMNDMFTTNSRYPEIIQNIEKFKEFGAQPTLTSSSSASSLTHRTLVAPLPGSHMVQVEIHSPPLDDSCDLRVAVRAKAPRIVLHKPFLDRMIQFFMPPQEVAWSVLAYSSAEVHELQGFSAMNLAETLQTHLSMNLSLDIAAPTFLLPRDPTSHTSDVLVVDLGRVKLQTHVQPRAERAAFIKRLQTLSREEQNRLEEPERAKCYDIYNIGVKQVQIYLTSASSIESGGAITAKTFLLNPFDASSDLWMAMSNEVTSMPDVRFIANLPLLQFNLSNSKYTRLMLLLATFENIISLFLVPPPMVAEPASGQQQKSIINTASLQSAQQMLMRRIAHTEEAESNLSAASSSSAPNSIADHLDLAALTKLMSGKLKDAQALMAQIDTDQSGMISRAEFQSWLSARQKAREYNETLDVQVQLQSISFILTDDASKSSRAQASDIMELRIANVGFKMSQQMHQLKLGLVIGALSIADLATPYQQSRYIINTSRDSTSTMVRATSRGPYTTTFIDGDEFINIRLVTTSDRSHTFSARPVELDLCIGFGQVAICIEPDSIYRIGTYVTNVFVLNHEVNSVLAGVGSSPVQVASQPASQSPQAIQSPPSSKVATKSPRAARISVSVAAHFESLRLQLFSKNQPIVEAVMNNLHGEVQLFQQGTVRVFMKMQETYIKDCTPAGITHPFAVSTQKSSVDDGATQDPLVRFSYDSFSDRESDYPGYNESIAASVRGLQFTYLQRLVWEVVLFVTMGPIADLIDFLAVQGVSNAATPTEAPNSTTDLTLQAATMSQDYAALAVSRFIKMDFSLKGVELILPQHSASNEFLHATIDKITCSNSLLPDPNDKSQLYQQLVVVASAFKVMSLIRAHGADEKLIVDLSPFSVVINLLGHLSRISIDVDVKSLTAALAPAQWNWIIGLTQLNFAEPAIIVQPIKKVRRTNRLNSASSPAVTPAKATKSPPPIAFTPAKASPVDPTALVFKLNASLRSLSFMLTENEYDPVTRDGALASFLMSDLFSGVSLLANGGMDVQSFCGGLSMTDISAGGRFIRGRPVLPEYRELLLVVDDGESHVGSGRHLKPPLFFNLNKTVDEHGTGWSVIEVSIATFRFNLGPVLFRLPTFFATPNQAEIAKNAAIIENLQIQAPTPMPTLAHLQATQAPAPQQTSYVVLKLFIAAPVIQFVRDPTARVSEAILLTFGAQTEILISNNPRQSVLSSDFHLTDVKCYTTQLDVSRAGFVQISDDPLLSSIIIQPFSAHGSVKVDTPSEAVDADTILEQIEDPTELIALPVLHATCVIDPITARLSYQTYRLAYRTLDALTNASSDDTVHSPSSDPHRLDRDIDIAHRVGMPPPVEPPSSGADAIQPLNNGSNSEDLESQVKVKKPQEVKLFHAEDISIELRQFHLSLINDASSIDIPIARVEVDHLKVKVHGYAHQRVFRGELGIGAEYYNQNEVRWEPMLEHYQLNFDLTSTYILSTVDFNRTLDPNTSSDEGDAASSSSALVSSDHSNLGDSTHSGAIVSNRLLITSPVDLNLNVTHTMFRGVMDCLDLFEVVSQKRKFESDDDIPVGRTRNSTHLLANGNRKLHDAAPTTTVGIADSHRRLYPYQFHNFTELTIDLTRQAHGTLNTSSSPKHHDSFQQPPLPMTVDPYSMISFDFPDDIPIGEHELVIHAHKSGCGTIGFNAPMRSTLAQSYTIPLVSDGSLMARVIFEIFVQDGVKVCRLRSPIGIKNQSNFPIEIKAITQDTHAEQATFPVMHPGDEYFCPLRSTHESGGFLVSMRPRTIDEKGTRALTDSQFDWGSPVILLAEYSTQNQYFGCEHRSSRSTRDASGSSTPTSESGQFPVGDFNCSLHIRHLWSDGEGDIDPAIDTVNASRDFVGQVYVIGPAMSIQNLLAADVEVRLADKADQTSEETVHWNATIPRGDKKAIYTLLKSHPTYMQLRIKSLLTQWSGLLALPMPPPEGQATTTFALSLFDANKRELQIHVEVSMQGTSKIVLYVPYFVYDLTKLGLILSCDRKQTVPLGPLDQFRQRVASNTRAPLMFNFPNGYVSNRPDVCLTTLTGVELARGWADVSWSQPILIDKIGLSTTITIPGPRTKILETDAEPTLRNLSDIGIRVEQAYGKYHRTKLVYLAPHFVLVNKLSCDIELMQRVSRNPALVHARSGTAPTFLLKAGATSEFHWLDHIGNMTVCMRRVGSAYSDWRWSGDLDPTAIGDVTIMVRHKSDPTRCWFMRAEIHIQDATVFMQISEFQPETLQTMLPYRIQNHCVHQNIRIRQYIPPAGSKGSTTPCPPCDWLTVNSYSILHFAPEVPIYSRPCQLEVQLGLTYREGAVLAERTIILNLDEIKTHARVNVPPITGDELGAHQMVYLYTESDGSATNVLKVANHPSADSFAAELRKGGNQFGHKQIISRQREKRWKELKEMQANLLTRLNMLQKRLAQETSRSASASRSKRDNPRPASIPPRQSAVIIEVDSARGLPMKDSYLVLTFDGLTHKTPIVQGTNSPKFKKQFIFNTTNITGSSAIKLAMFEETNMFVADKERAAIEFSVYDLDHESKTSWLPLRTQRGDSAGELLCTIWHVPKAEQQHVESALSEVDGMVSEKRRILASVESEMKTMQRRRMIDDAGEVMPVHLQNDVQFKLELKSIDGFDEALSTMRAAGDVVCRVRSELTGKTASIFCLHYEPDYVLRSRLIKLDWLQEVSVHIPEELLAQRDEVLHLSFFFHPQDMAADESPVHSQAKQVMINRGFLKATKLRANCPPIPLAHVSIPLSAIPVHGSKLDAESRIGTKTQRERKLIDWHENRIPLQVDLYSYNRDMWVTVSIIQLPARSEENRSQFCVKLSLPMVSLSLVDSEPKEILFFSVAKTDFSFDDTLCTNDLALKIDRIQIDNQCVGALFPIILGFTPIEPEEFQPMIQLSIAKKKSRVPNIQIYEYASLLIQQFDVRVEEELIYTVIRFVNSFLSDDADQLDDVDDSKWFVKSIDDEFAVSKEEETMLFMEFLQIQPIAVNVWFQAAPGMRARMSRMKYNPMEIALSIAGTAMGSIQGAPIRLNGRTFEHVRGSIPVILGSLGHHYKRESISEAYKVVGSLEFLGNPVGLVNNLGTGVIDFFYLPSKGAVESPEKFGIGLAKGSLSLVKGVTSGIFNTVGSITGSVSKGIAMASLDERFIEGNATRQQSAPKNVADGMLQGGKSLAGGLFQGIAGLVTDPYKGAKSGGAEGFFKGVGRGLLGVVAKPAAGAVGFASQTLTGIGNTAEFLSDSRLHPTHVRPQRFIRQEEGIQPYDRTQAEANEVEQKRLYKLKKKGKPVPSPSSSSAAAASAPPLTARKR